MIPRLRTFIVTTGFESGSLIQYKLLTEAYDESTAALRAGMWMVNNPSHYPMPPGAGKRTVLSIREDAGNLDELKATLDRCYADRDVIAGEIERLDKQRDSAADRYRAVTSAVHDARTAYEAARRKSS